MTKQTPFSRFEALAQRLVEGSFNRLFGGQAAQLNIAVRLARTLEDTQVDGRAAERFHIRLHPQDFDAIFQQTPDAPEELSDYLVDLAQIAGLSLSARPHITITAEPTVDRNQVQIEAYHAPEEDAITTQLRRIDSAYAEALADLQALDAYLIVDGRRHVPLDRPFISIGRRTENDIVLDSPSVSRQHAQIRWRYGRFVLYDLSNRGRTRVNHQPVTEYILQQGDVIALSNVLLIYGEGQTAARPSTSKNALIDETQIMPKKDQDS